MTPRSLIGKLAAAMRGGPAWRGGPGEIVATLYEDGVIVEVSPSAEETIGAAGRLEGRSLFDFIAREDRAAVRAALAHAAKHGAYADPGKLRAEFRLLRVRRAPASAEINFKPLGRGRLAALIRDRREEFSKRRVARSAAEAAAGEAPAAPNAVCAAGTVPARADRAHLMADLSHEMKTPLNAIMGFADAMRAETYGGLGHEKYKEYAEHIHASGAHLMELIGAILDFAKVEEGRYVLSPAIAAPGPVARECAEMVRGEAEKAGLKLLVNIASDLPETMIDKRAVRQILLNLLSNAVKFTAEGEIELSVEEKCGAIDFTVRDTGVGMNTVVLSKLGGRWSDTHQNGVRGTKGAGLGLSLAFSLAKLHGGNLRLDSEPGAGTTARLTLPVRRVFAQPAQETAAPASPPDIQSQFDRVNAYRRERAKAA